MTMTYDQKLKTLVLDGFAAGRTAAQIRALVEEAISIEEAINEELKAPVIRFPVPHRVSA